MQNVTVDDFTVSGTTATVTSVAMWLTANFYDVTVSGGDLAGLNGTISLEMAAGNNVQNEAVTALSTAAPDRNQTYVMSDP